MMPGMQGSLAEKLRVLRARKGLTLVEASKAIGIDRHTLRDLELGKRAAYFPTIEKIAMGYDVAPATLVAESEADSEAAGVEQEPALSGKAEAPPATLSSSEAGQQSVESRALEAFDALASYVEQRAALYEADLKDPNSPLFANRAMAAVWASTVDREAFMLSWLVIAQANPLLRSMTSEESRRTANHHVQRIAQHLVELAEVSKWAQERFGDLHNPNEITAQHPFFKHPFFKTSRGQRIIDMTPPEHHDVTQPGQRPAVTPQAAQALQEAAKEIQEQVA